MVIFNVLKTIRKRAKNSLREVGIHFHKSKTKRLLAVKRALRQNCLDNLPHISGYVDLLEKDQIADFYEAFEMYDMNYDGKITNAELGEVMRSLGENPTEPELAKIIAEVDIDGNGTIEFNEFLHLMAKKYFERDIDSDIATAFKIFDRDGNGQISATEFRFVMMHLGEQMTEAEVDQMMFEADINGDALISRYEFRRMILC